MAFVPSLLTGLKVDAESIMVSRRRGSALNLKGIRCRMESAEPAVETEKVNSDPNGLVRIKRVLVSVSDKTSIVNLCQFLTSMGVEVISTGGSAKILMENGVAVTEVSDYTEFPELLDGRLKTLNPKIHGGLLGIRDNEDHHQAMAEHGILPIDACVVNLYPFEETVNSGADFGTCVENIDVGGPAMIRAAAKNFKSVTVVTEVDQYAELLTELAENDGCTSLALREKYAGAAYARTAVYDAKIASWFSMQGEDHFPERLVISGTLKQRLRYGENPHQRAAFYVSDGPKRLGAATSEIIQGKELSYNNIADTDAAWELVCEFNEPAVAIIKHANPCGAAVGVNPMDAYLRALACDPISAFGGIVAFNRTLDKDAAEEVIKTFTEVVIAPDSTAEALQILSQKKNLRVLLTGGIPADELGWTVKSVASGYLVQDRDAGSVTEAQLQIVTKRAPTAQEITDMLFAWKVSLGSSEACTIRVFFVSHEMAFVNVGFDTISSGVQVRQVERDRVCKGWIHCRPRGRADEPSGFRSNSSSKSEGDL
mmetsp:Transcript_8072/g.35886  ORF Transcript_8072/g.35886 Transcript_8072/m.35886 type:complete len:540 (-) Transcript_8072:621-2240(-)